MAFSSLRPIVIAGAATAALLLAACSGGDEKPAGANPSLPTLNDEQYLLVLCTGINDYREAVNTATSAESLTQSIRAYVADLQAANPPADLQSFHGDYLRYLEQSYTDPTRLLTTLPPMPPDAARARLSTKEASVIECKPPTFWNRAPQ
jgi:hypothetical protein